MLAAISALLIEYQQGFFMSVNQISVYRIYFKKHQERLLFTA